MVQVFIRNGLEEIHPFRQEQFCSEAVIIFRDSPVTGLMDNLVYTQQVDHLVATAKACLHYKGCLQPPGYTYLDWGRGEINSICHLSRGDFTRLSKVGIAVHKSLRVVVSHHHGNRHCYRLWHSIKPIITEPYHKVEQCKRDLLFTL